MGSGIWGLIGGTLCRPQENVPVAPGRQWFLKTTIVIPNYNGKKFLKNCLDSVTKSSVLASVIVVDNGSQDASPELLATEYPEVTVIPFPENRGFCAAVNAGIRAAKTPYVFLLNNDTTIEPDCIERLEQTMDQDRRIFSVGAGMRCMYQPKLMDGAGDLYSAFGWAYAIGKGKPCERYDRQQNVFSNCAGAALYRKEYLEITGLFDENHFAYLEDVDLGYRARIAGFQNVVEPRAVVYHAGSGSTGSRYNAFKVSHSSRNNVYLIYKNMPILQLILNLPLLTAGFLIKIVFFGIKGFGGIYLKGILEGIKLGCSEAGRRQKVPFHWKNLPNYGKIQLELWINLFRRI
ncbi:MAG: glycosyltransferase family 2 protein [Lachnospiraceae bacterium]|nr:glycosyltransferase family 2 protein [Lachnospiraceae bacterium]